MEDLPQASGMSAPIPTRLKKKRSQAHAATTTTQQDSRKDSTASQHSPKLRRMEIDALSIPLDVEHSGQSSKNGKNNLFELHYHLYIFWIFFFFK